MTPTTTFENLDREARLAVLRDVQHHSGIESNEYIRLARMHELLLNRAHGHNGRRPSRKTELNE
jgi:hypothetical protein